MVTRINIPITRIKEKKGSYALPKSEETDTVELKYTDIDGLVDNTKLYIYENGTDEELWFLKLIKEF
jgi:hypothetical protein